MTTQPPSVGAGVAVGAGNAGTFITLKSSTEKDETASVPLTGIHP